MKNFIFTFLLTFTFSFFLNASEVEILKDVPGSGPIIKNHYKISVHYRGFLEDGTEFDSSFKRNTPFVFQIGTRQVILGWEQALIGMKVGGKRTIKIPPDLAYGSRGAGELIPPNATLIFDIEIISIKPPNYILIDSNKLSSMITNEKILLIDIRTEDEWKKTGIIKRSKKINAFDSKGNFNPGFVNSFKSQTKNKLETKAVLISKTGYASSILANGLTEQLGYTNIFSLEGGIDSWLLSGFKLK